MTASRGHEPRTHAASATVIPAALAGIVAGASAGMLAAPDVLAVPGLLAVAGLALGMIVGLVVAGRRTAPRPPEPERVADRHIAESPPPWPLAPPPPGADPAPGWYPDPRDSAARRYWDGDFWTEHLWHARPVARRRRVRL